MSQLLCCWFPFFVCFSFFIYFFLCARCLNGEGNETVVLGNVSLEDVSAWTENTLESIRWKENSRKQNIRLYIWEFNMKYENVGSVDGITVVYRVSHISNGLWWQQWLLLVYLITVQFRQSNRWGPIDRLLLVPRSANIKHSNVFN